jgi:hypothetical protein
MAQELSLKLAKPPGSHHLRANHPRTNHPRVNHPRANFSVGHELDLTWPPRPSSLAGPVT